MNEDSTPGGIDTADDTAEKTAHLENTIIDAALTLIEDHAYSVDDIVAAIEGAR